MVSPSLTQEQHRKLRELCDQIDANMAEIRRLRDELGLQPGEPALGFK